MNRSTKDYNESAGKFGLFLSPDCSLDDINRQNGEPREKILPFLGHNDEGVVIYHNNCRLSSASNQGLPRRYSGHIVVSYASAISEVKPETSLSYGATLTIAKLTKLGIDFRRYLESSEVFDYTCLVNFISDKGYDRRSNVFFSTKESVYASYLVSIFKKDGNVVTQVLHNLYRDTADESSIAFVDNLIIYGDNAYETYDMKNLAAEFLEIIVTDAEKNKLLTVQKSKESTTTKKDYSAARIRGLQAIYFYTSLGIRYVDLYIYLRKITNNSPKLLVGYTRPFNVLVNAKEIESIKPINLSLLMLDDEIDPSTLYDTADTQYPNLRHIDIYKIVTDDLKDANLLQLKAITSRSETDKFIFNTLISNVLYTRKDLIAHVIKNGIFQKKDATENKIKRYLLMLFYDTLATEKIVQEYGPEDHDVL